MKQLFIILILTILIIPCKVSISAQEVDQSWIDYIGRDESVTSTARTITIAGLEWMVLNLNVDHFSNGDPIQQARTEAEWMEAWMEGIPAWSYYDNQPAMGDLYGKLYNRHALADSRGVCPEGWRLPGYEDWNTLFEELGGEAGMKMKSTTGWNEDNGYNSSGFNAQPGGIRYCNGQFYGMGDYAILATSGNERPGTGRLYLTGYGSLKGGMNPSRYERGDDGLSVRCVREKPYHGFSIVPSGVPNPGIMFVNNEARGRSGHFGSTLTELQNGDILAFYGNTSGIMKNGHLADGWAEYKRSTDGGKTWSRPTVFQHSKDVWNTNRKQGRMDQAANAVVSASVTAANGNVIAFTMYWGDWRSAYHISHNNGWTWSEPRNLNPSSPEKRTGYIYNAAFVHNDTIYVLAAEGRLGPIVLHFSTDHGETFQKRSHDLFPGKETYYYHTGRILDNGQFVVYAYLNNEDEDILRVISEDNGLTWSEPEVVSFAKRIRNPQMSSKVGGYYFMHGRSGSRGPDAGHLVLYSSSDGLNWDDGIYLNRGEGVFASRGSDSYSANVVVGTHDPDQPERLLIQSSIHYSRQRVNTKHWWIEDILGTELSTN